MRSLFVSITASDIASNVDFISTAIGVCFNEDDVVVARLVGMHLES